jgi:hypothetical protein
VAIHHFVVAAGEHRNLEAELADRRVERFGRSLAGVWQVFGNNLPTIRLMESAYYVRFGRFGRFL